MTLRRTSSILKLPRTPGTGRSVRFTESIIDHGQVDGDGSRGSDEDAEEEEEEEEEEFEREDSPSIIPGSRQQRTTTPKYQSEEREDQTESALDFSAMTSRDSIMTTRAGGGVGGHSSFLDKLKEVIPSPDVSLVVEEEGHLTSEEEKFEKTEVLSKELESPKPEAQDLPIEISHVEETSTLSTASTTLPASDDPSPTPLDADDPSLSTLSFQPPSNISSTSAMLFDESNPCHFNNSVSVLGASTLRGAGAGFLVKDFGMMEVLTETEEEQEVVSIVPSTPRSEGATTEFDLSRTPTSNPSRLERQQSSNQEEEDSPLRQSDLSSTTDSNRSEQTARSFDATRSNKEVPNEKITSPSPNQPVDEKAGSQETDTLLRPSSTTHEADSSHSQSFYRKFMASRALLGGSQTAAEEWNRLERGEKASPKEQSREVEEAEGTSVYYSPARGDEFEEEEDEVERVLIQGGSFYELAPADQILEEELLEEDGGSVVDYGGLVRTFLSPIVELVSFLLQA
jgi:hypothetical protein